MYRRAAHIRNLKVLLVLFLCWTMIMPAAPAWAAGQAAKRMSSSAEAVPAETGLKPEQAITIVKGGLTLEQAITIVKGLVTIPPEFDDFSSSYTETERGQSFWYLNWEGTGAVQGTLSAQVNALTGDLWSFNLWTPEDYTAGSRRGLPKLDYAQAKAQAVAFLQRVLPNYVAQLQLQEEATAYPYVNARDRGPVSYQFNFERVKQGYLFAEDRAQVEVDGDTGKIRSYYFNWDDQAKFPSPNGKLAPEKAGAIWRAHAGVELIYYRPDLRPGEQAPVKLVYAPRERALQVDALSGEVLKPEQYFYAEFDMGSVGGSDLQKRDANVPLTPAEEKAVGELENLLSREEALAKVKEKIRIPEGFISTGISLERDWRYPDLKIWNFSWRHQEEKGYLHVQVEAKNGLVIGYNYSLPENNTSKEPVLGEKEARALGTTFLKQMVGPYMSTMQERQVVPCYDPPVRPLEAGKKRPIGYGFEYTRLVNNLPFPNNGARVFVDTCSGQVTSYRCQWWDLEFPKPQAVISKAAAEKIFLDQGFTLAYQREPWSYYQPVSREGNPIRFVYYLDPGKVPSVVDALTGQGLQANLEPKLKKGNLVFTDLAGHPAQQAVETLAAVHVIPVNEPIFSPDKPLRQRDFLIWLLRATGWQPGEPVLYGSAGGQEDMDKEFASELAYARSLRILYSGEVYAPQDPVTFQTVARLSIRALGWSEVADLTGIWNLPAALTTGVSAADEGYLTLAVKIGLTDLGQPDISPRAKLTRGEGAIVLYRLLNFR